MDKGEKKKLNPTIELPHLHQTQPQE
jgi:hypothetical protein